MLGKDLMIACNPDVPESVDAQQTQISFHRRAGGVTTSFGSRQANRADVLSALCAAADQHALHSFL